MSAHEVLVVKVKNIFPHPEPATTALEIVKIWDYEFIVRKGDFKLGDLAVVVEPDYVVPVTHDLFKFLDVKGTGKPQRITTKRLRGIWSQGLVVPALPHHKEGQNVIEELGIIRYEPKVNQYHGWGSGQLDSGIMDKEPVIPGTTSIPKYDLENLKKYASTLEEGEQVIYTTKLHGCVFGDTVLETLEKGNITIREVVDQKLELHVKCLNIANNEIEYQKISDFSKKKSTNNWYQIELESGQILKVTGNDRVWLPELKCWRQVDQLSTEDILMID